MNILETEALSHDFSGFKVLQGVNLEVKEGECHALIGPNGAGKTTLFNVISGKLRPRRGQVLFRGRDVTGYQPYRLARLGMGRSFQITSVFGKLTAFENLRMAVMSRMGIRFRLLLSIDGMSKLTQETDRALRALDLEDQHDVAAGLLSYGKGRGLEVGLAAAIDPELILLDEPSAGMSREETRHLISLIRQMGKGKTVVMIEHDMDVVFSLADRITVLHQGSILATGEPDEIRRDAGVKEAYLGHDEDS